MKRDMDYIRELLLEIEGGRDYFETLSKNETDVLGIETDESLDEIAGKKRALHLDLLAEAGLIRLTHVGGGGGYYVERPTWDGYEFIETMRDPTIWSRTKGAAGKAGGVGFGVLLEIGKSLVKGELAKHGIPLG